VRRNPVDKRTLGDGLEVSAIGFGCMGMSQSYGPNPGDRDQMIALCARRSSAA
jgi:aryl-alcohol dehydrogenase-like predicted oxidoreductase